MNKATKQLIESLAWDATVGSGDDSERVWYVPLENSLDHEPSDEERRVFASAWARCVQEMAQP